MRTLLVLARVSNLPTVWSNCLAAWLLAGGGPWTRFALVCLGATLLYTGGMFLNDAVDEAFDRRYRPERPIVSGQIASRSVWILSGLLLVGGCATLGLLGNVSAWYAGGLAAMIIFYDLVHKRTVFAPFPMAACRLLLYLTAASVLGRAATAEVVRPAAALGVYIVGLSYLARGESTGGIRLRWPVALLFIPALLAVIVARMRFESVGWIVALQVLWTLWCLAGRRPALIRFIPQGVSGLLAGIALVDLLAAAGCGFPAPFLCLFALAILLQRVAPAT